MATALYRNWLSDDLMVAYNARLVANVITKGDFVIGSGTAIIAAESSLNASSLRMSGLGIALENNPIYDSRGVAVANTALMVAKRGLFRVSAISATNEGHWPYATPVFPATTGSGIVGQTGATGVGAIWATADVVADTTGWSAARAYFSGVGQVVKLVKVGDVGVAQADILLNPQGPIGYY